MKILNIYQSVEDRDRNINAGMEKGMKEAHNSYAELLNKLKNESK